MSDLLEVQRGQVYQLLSLGMRVLLVELLQLVLRKTTHRMHAANDFFAVLLVLESVLQLSLNGLDFLLKRIIALKLPLIAAILLLERVNERRFAHVDAVLPLDFVCVVHEEGLVAGKLFSDGSERHVVDRAANLKSIHRGEQFFCDVENVSREQSPLALRLDKRALCVLFLLFEDNVVSLQNH